jgi:hypothetical protein
MFFVVFNYYCKNNLDSTPWDFLEINKSGWFRFQKENRMVLHHCKTICKHFNHHITDDLKELLLLVATNYVEAE